MESERAMKNELEQGWVIEIKKIQLRLCKDCLQAFLDVTESLLNEG